LYIDSDFFPEKRLINNSVSAASLNDFLAIYDMYEKKGFKPDKIILGICPEMLNYNESKFYTSIEENYSSMLNKIGLKPGKDLLTDNRYTLRKWKEIISLSYFKKSIERAFNDMNIEPTRNKVNKGATRVLDGSLNDGDFYTKKTKDNIENSVMRLIGKPAVELEKFPELNPSETDKLEHFVDYLQSQNVEVIFYLMVYHPVYYVYVWKKYPILTQVENYIVSYAEKRGIMIYGQNDPAKCNLSDNDFTDYCHLFKTGLLKVFNIKKDYLKNDSKGENI
jgi:hypothetical protein